MRKIVCPLFVLTFTSVAFSQNYTIQTFAGGAIPQNIQAAAASLGTVTGIAADAAGNVYIALQTYSTVVRMDPAGALTLVAGTGTAGYSGDNGPATKAQLNAPWGIALDTAGNLYIADSGNNRIRKVSNGVITTVAGNIAGAQLSNPTGVAVDSSGNLYIADSGNQIVRKVSGGVTVTVAGTGIAGFNAYSGAATSVLLDYPWGVAVDASGNLYIADLDNGLIREVTPSGALTSVLQATQPTGVSVVGASLYVAAFGNAVVASFVPPAGAVSIVAGTLNAAGYAGDNGAATNAQLNGPLAVAVDPSGNVYISDYYNDVVRKVAGGIITTAAGGPQGYVGDNGAATSALLFNPTYTATGPSGEVYIVDSNHNVVRKVANGVITTVAGTGVPGYSGDNGAAVSATLNTPFGVAADAAGNLYISDSGNNVIRKVSGGVITTIAGNGTANYSGDNGAATSAALNEPSGIALDAAGNLYIADYGNNRLRMVSNGSITTVAGNGTGAFGGDGLAATTASLLGPIDVKIDAAGNLYIADQGNNRIRMVTSGVISTVAGSGTATFGGDNGAATSAQLNGPSGIALDAAGNLVIADTSNNVIRQVSNGIITTLAGNGTASYGGDNGPAAAAALNAPLGVATDKMGRIFVADSGNNLVRVMNPPCNFALTATSVQVPGAGGSFNIGVQTAAFCSWSVSGLPAWVTLGSASSATGPANVVLIIAAAGGAPRSASIVVAGISVTINQAATCTYAISAGGQAFPPAGGIGMVTVTAPIGCGWSATNTVPFVSFSGGATGSGSGALTFLVAANSGGGRSGTFTVAGLPFEVEQQAPSIAGLNLIGSIAHLAAEENWTTTYTLVNKDTVPATAQLNFFGDATIPGDINGIGPLTLPLTFPQQPATAGPLLAASLDRTIASNGSLIIATGGPQTPPVLIGSTQLAATGAVDGFAIFHHVVTTQEAVLPLEVRNASSYVLAFDNTNNVVMGVAVANVVPQNAVIPVVIRDDTGTVISTPGTTVSLGANAHISFGLADPILGFPITAGKRGTIEFDTPFLGKISVVGIRFTPPNNALTTIPALANVGTGGGSFAHIASGGDGWQTTFALVNLGSSAAQATLSFFGDNNAYSSDPNGAGPLTLPLVFPQGNIAATMASSVTQTLAAGATLIVQSSGAPQQLLLGSAQLTTTGHVSGFAIYRHNDQEAVVPLESRNASGYILAYDNTNGTFTGVAINSVSAQAVNVPVTVRDDTGAIIATEMLALPPNGHSQFTLSIDKYPATKNIRGTIEFDTPAGAQIGALALRIPAGDAHTYTSLPALAK